MLRGFASVPALAFAAFLAAIGAGANADAADSVGAGEFRKDIQPILKEFCYDCHGDGAKKGNVTLDAFASDAEVLGNRELWWKALKNLRTGLMPPAQKPQPGAAQKHEIERWVKTAVFQIDLLNPDPGRVTIRRLNRVEYRNTIRDLMGVDFDTEKEFPPDDAGYGFDTIGDVLTLSPILLEKYLAAARTVVTKAVPSVPRIPAERVINGGRFKRGEEPLRVPTVADATGRMGTTNTPGRRGSGRARAAGRDNGSGAGMNRVAGGGPTNTLSLSYYGEAAATNVFTTTLGGRYQVGLDFTANERFVEGQFDYNKCRLVFKSDGQELHSHEYTREGGRAFHFEFDQAWKAGPHELILEVHPVTPDQKQVRSLTVRLDAVTVRGPLEEAYWVRPPNYRRFFPRDVPASATARRKYAREILEPFLTRAFRRPADPATVDRLVTLAESTYRRPGKTFEAGVGQAMVAALASPHFLFREEGLEASIARPSTAPAPSGHPWVDEYALASRLSYLLWASAPDDELLRLAGQGKLRANLTGQTARLLEDRRSDALVRNFVGQWLQTRDVETVVMDARQVLAREAPVDPQQDRRRARFRELRDKHDADLTEAERKELEDLRANLFRRFNQPLRAEMTAEVRRAMRSETEMTFDHILRHDRSLLELLDSDYTFLNEKLARHYGLTNLNVTGDRMRLVKLPPESPRGGILTQGSVLAVTSNPTRTSPVKRGLFILENLLGTPPPPPPPNIPPLEDAAKGVTNRALSLRETLALHREQPLCASCHNRMDPLGLALENFNAMGMWRDQERGQAVDAAGKLLSGESFTHVNELKRILATRHATEFYRTMTEKLLIYALGRGLEYYDVGTVDAIVDRLQQSGGRPSALLSGIIESAPFQKTRASGAVGHASRLQGSVDRADLRTSP